MSHHPAWEALGTFRESLKDKTEVTPEIRQRADAMILAAIWELADGVKAKLAESRGLTDPAEVLRWERTLLDIALTHWANVEKYDPEPDYADHLRRFGFTTGDAARLLQG